MAKRPKSVIDWFVDRFNQDARAAGKARWVEKTPSHIHHIGVLLKRFPQARILMMLRDGRDVACSVHARYGDFDRGVRGWLTDNAVAEPYFNNLSTHLVRYEDLINDRERCLQEILDFIGEPFETALLKHHTGSFRFLGADMDSARHFARTLRNVTERPESAFGAHHRRYRSWQASQPVFDGRGRWQHDLTEVQKARFKQLAGKQLIAYGYATDQEW